MTKKAEDSLTRDENIAINPSKIKTGTDSLPQAQRRWTTSNTGGKGMHKQGLKPGQRAEKTPEHIKAYCREFGYEAVDTLVSAMRDGENYTVKMRAACEILNRGVGKPAQQIEHVGPHGGPIQEIRAIIIDPQIRKN